MRSNNFALRLQPSLMEAAREIAKAEGVAVNQLINVAVAQMIAVHHASSYMTMRAARANPERALDILNQAGRDNPPIAGDELPEGWAKRHPKKAAAKS
ncbi:MAG: toxin-antitoxin system HicB family antitoxin [Terracidiphilus sp.]|nr:toxin-antitoxin system HicB family antitoxin [Terracidiphilus sp.]